MQCVSFTKSSLPFGIFGNMSRCEIEFDGKTWTSSEALFQSMRFSDGGIKEQIRLAKGGFAAKLIAKKHADLMVIQRCCPMDVENMRKCLIAKKECSDAFRVALIESSDMKIIEDVTARGAAGTNLFWGMMNTDCRFIGEDGWIGMNVLGNLLMSIR